MIELLKKKRLKVKEKCKLQQKLSVFCYAASIFHALTYSGWHTVNQILNYFLRDVAEVL
jgi:hypothetical protein